MVVNGIDVTVEGLEDVSEQEIMGYIDYVKEHTDNRLGKLCISAAGDGNVTLNYALMPQKFERIRRITGSATSSCVLFGKLQTGSAQAIGASESVQAWIAASNATGACAGKMISPQSIAIGVAAIGAKGIDGQLLQFAVKVYIPFIIVMGCIVYFGQTLVG